MRDEHPGMGFLTATEVRKLVRRPKPADFARFLADNPKFPPLIQVGTTAKGKPRMLYSKARVYAFLELLGA